MTGAECDVVVIGGGPAGSTAAALLAERGRDVVLLERDTHPRFHIGESLLPRNLAIFERLGIAAQVAAVGVFKPGAEFVTDPDGVSVMFRFADAIGAECPHSYHVNRADLDALLFATAAAKGARARQGMQVTEVAFLPAGGARVTALGEDGEALVLTARFVLDASGRDTFLAGRMRTIDADKANNTAAVYAHVRGVEPRDGARAGCISVHLVEDGWFWLIPLPDGVTSVGFVGTRRAFKARRGGLDAFLAERIERSPTVRARLRHATFCSAVMSAGNYSYRARSAWGEGYMLIGDAFGFVDPVFSSGVLLAMSAAELGADVAAAWLDDPARGRVLARRAERRIGRAMDRLNWLIYRINDPVLRHMFMSPSNVLRMRDGVVSVLAGNIDAPRRRLPMLAFKTAYRLLALSGRFAPPHPAG